MRKTINDSFLGTIQYSEEYDWYEGKIKNCNDEVIKFSFDIDDNDNNFEETLKLTRKEVKKLRDRPLKYKLYAADKLLDLYNDTWSENEIIDREEFANRIELESVNVCSDGSATIYYRDGDLFAGHSIIIYRNSEGGLEEVEIAG